MIDGRGAKVAMTLALRSPKRISAMISVDNAPVDAMLKSDFGKYVQGMRMIEDANVTKQVEADAILKTVEKVHGLLLYENQGLSIDWKHRYRLFPYVNFS